jgi:hypothetical protein
MQIPVDKADKARTDCVLAMDMALLQKTATLIPDETATIP